MVSRFLTQSSKVISMVLLCSSGVASAQDFSKKLTELSVANHRSEANIARNQYRHPVETLEFFGLQENMTVVEIWPSSGWYTEILAPAVKDKGQYHAAGFVDDGNAWRKQRIQEFSEKLKAAPEIYGKVKVTTLGTTKSHAIVPANSADMVLTFRNVHNWMKDDYAQAVFDQMYAALKPGGVLGVVEHRAKTDTSFDEQITSGYVTVEQVKAYAKNSGFKFVASSEVNANAKDSTQHLKGVWTLPPALRMGEQDKQKYLAIGESDRMTLKFIKPAQ